nr:unnamed protein product [Callosobruchus chinensis]
MPSTKTTELGAFVVRQPSCRSVDRCRLCWSVRYCCSLLSDARVFCYQCYGTAVTCLTTVTVKCHQTHRCHNLSTRIR